jgi:hypothetical protein
VVVLTNLAQIEVEVRVVLADGKPQDILLRPGAVWPISAGGEFEVQFASAAAMRHRLVRPDSIISFRGDAKRMELDQVRLGREFEQDSARVPPVRPADTRLASGVLPVKLLIDDREPERQQMWEPRLRLRLQMASDILQRYVGVRLEVVALGTWKTSAPTTTFAEALGDFERNVEPGPARLAIGFTRQYPISPEEFARSGGLHGPLRTHMLVPDSTRQVTSDEALKMLLHELGHFWGAVHVTQTDTLMGLQLRGPIKPGQPLGFDPANTLAMNLVAEEVRTRGVSTLNELSPIRKRCLERIYAELAAPDQQRGALVRLTEIPIPDVPGGYAIWSGVSSDRTGHHWFAVSSKGVHEASAHVFELEPASTRPVDRGDVIFQLRTAGRLQVGEHQGLICSPILQAADGNLYFASLGEEQPWPDGSRPPRWGSHLWRLRLPMRRWEHLAAVPEGVAALACHGKYLYSLGYPGHVLSQYHLKTGQRKHVDVGSAAGHICRSLICDSRGHVYVPCLKGPRQNGKLAEVVLSEFDEQLREVPATPAQFHQADQAQSRGSTGHDATADGAVFFTTQSGGLYRLCGRDAEGAQVECLVDSDDTASVAILPSAADAVEHRLVIVAFRSRDSEAFSEWIAYDLGLSRSAVLPGVRVSVPSSLEFCGLAAIDRTGTLYLAGTYARGPLQLPPGLLDFLKARGYSDARLSQLQENAKRIHQPALFTVREAEPQ